MVRGDGVKPLKEKISITIDSDVLAKAKSEAEKDDRSLSQYINIVLKAHIKNTENKTEPWMMNCPQIVRTVQKQPEWQEELNITQHTDFVFQAESVLFLVG